MPGRDERRRNSADEQGQGRINQQLVLPTPGGINQGAPDLVKAKVQQDQAHKWIAREVHPDLQDGTPVDEERDDDVGEVVP